MVSFLEQPRICPESWNSLYAQEHHATERYGVKALGEHLAQHFGLQHLFLSILIIRFNDKVHQDGTNMNEYILNSGRLKHFSRFNCGRKQRSPVNKTSCFAILFGWLTCGRQFIDRRIKFTGQ